MEHSQRSYKDDFVEFFKKPSFETLPEFLRNHMGEEDFLDFKENWPEDKDIARHILGMSNSGGGMIVVGVKEENDSKFDPIGITGEWRDKTHFADKISRFIPEHLMALVRLEDFDFGGEIYNTEIRGKRFQIVIVPDSPDRIPFLAIKGTSNLRTDAIYVRKGSSSQVASGEDIQRLINRRLESGKSASVELSLDHHLNQLHVLYSHIPRYKQSGITTLAESMSRSLFWSNVKNPEYPQEDYTEFINSCISKKKSRIRRELDLGGLPED